MKRRLGALVGPAVASVLATTLVCPPRSQACTVAGDDVGFGAGLDFDDQDVLVRPPGATPFRLTSLAADRVLATLPVRPGGRTRIEVHDVVSFSGTTEGLTYFVTKPVDTAQGMVNLYRGAALARVMATGDAQWAPSSCAARRRRWKQSASLATPCP